MFYTFFKQKYNFLCNDLIGYYESIHDLTVRRTEAVNSERMLSVGVRQGCPLKRLLYLQKLFKRNNTRAYKQRQDTFSNRRLRHIAK